MKIEIELVKKIHFKAGDIVYPVWYTSSNDGSGDLLQIDVAHKIKSIRIVCCFHGEIEGGGGIPAISYDIHAIENSDPIFGISNTCPQESLFSTEREAKEFVVRYTKRIKEIYSGK